MVLIPGAGHVGIIVFNPCGNVSEEGDFLSVMSSNLQGLKTAFRQAEAS